MEKILVKKKAEPHFTKEFDGRTTSDRIILPEKDECRVKVTMFRPKAGFTIGNIVYPCDETVHMVAGRLRITLADGTDVDLEEGDTYFVPAGFSYSLSAVEDGEALCVFSQAGDGPLPDNS